MKAPNVIANALRACGIDDPERAEVMEIMDALRAAGYVIVHAPTIYHKGPNDTDASMLRTAADKAESARYPVGGSNVGRAVASVLREVAQQIEGAKCKHCGLLIEKRPEKSLDWLHAEGDQQGMHTCALNPYGFHAEPVGAPCSDHPANPCNGSRALT